MRDWTGELQEALRLLASDPADQLRHLTAKELHPDELALDYDDTLRVVLGNQDISKPVAQALLAVNAKLGQMSGSENAELWTIAAIRSSPEWEKVRALAGQALQVWQIPG